MKDKVMSVGWWLSRVAELTVALGLFYLTTSIIEYREAVSKSNVVADEWFVLREIFVPDHEVGSNPDMLYDRVILEPHRGFWVVEAQRINPDGKDGVFQNACSGSGINEYDPDEVLTDNTVDWEWFFGRPCAVPAGMYRLQLTRDMAKPGYPVKQMRAYSNTFHVTDPYRP